ncbi:MAG: MMPL family transporter [Bacteroidetes bacterium]|nr:MMPL family transporter [Bacteroidota bacterium]
MWDKLSYIIIKFRLPLLIILGLVTVFMAYKAVQVTMSYNLAKVVPKDDPDMIVFEAFKEQFGEDGNIVALAIKDSAVYQVDNFRKFKYLSDEIATLEGITEVISLPAMQKMMKDTKVKKFYLEPIFPEIPDSQEKLDSMLAFALDQKFYSGQIINPENGAIMILAGIDKVYANSKKRIHLIDDIHMLGKLFTESTGIDLHYVGLPFVRAVIVVKVKREMQMFVLLSVLITGLIMLLFFRSKTAVIFPLLIIGVIVIWVLGTIVLMQYKITLLTGVIPSIIVIIGIPNSIYLLNKYHQEYNLHKDKSRAIRKVIQKIGVVTLITNATTAVGFGVLGFTDVSILKEFGIVAAINIMATFVVSIILLPSVFSYLPPPSWKHLKHLSFKPLDKILTGLDLLVHRYKYPIFFVTGVVIVLALVGLYRVKAIAFMVDDIPEDSQIKKDLYFFENNFSGIMPLEIIIDTGRPKGVHDLKNLTVIDEFEQFLQDQKYISKPVSVVSFIKAMRQAFYNNNPDWYSLPNKRDRNFILRYFNKEGEESSLLSAFVDSTNQIMRISLKVADIGSDRMDSLINNVIVPKKEEVFKDTKMKATITGTTLLFIKGNNFLVSNLKFSFLLAFFIIAIIMGMLFANLRMIIISLIPNIIPLVITAGIMGFAGIPLKPSTAIVFSIAFGISVDYAIHFLAKYRQELFSSNFFVPVAVSKALREIGPSMIYTSVVLFAGFIIFTFSDFGGTVALGFLTSTTLFISLLTNLILLPALLLAFDDGKRKKDMHPLIEQTDNVYKEEDDEEIDVEQIEVKNKTSMLD